MKYEIPFNKPFLTGKETSYIEKAVNSGQLAGNGNFTKKCQSFFEDRYGFKKCFLTTSCTDALEMAAILIDIKPGDEVIIPSYTFVSTANAFALRGAVIKFADSSEDNPNIKLSRLADLITEKTKAIVVVHYAGVACEMDEILELCKKHSIFLVEDAAQAIESFYKGIPLGSFGHFSTFSFHETKNIISGEGGLLVVNDEKFISRAEIIWEKGTNRKAFFRGEVDKYTWVDIGSSFLPSEMTAAFLFAQLENIEKIQSQRIKIWNRYKEELSQVCETNGVKTLKIPKFATNNGHLFYLILNSDTERSSLINHLKSDGILAVFHYISLHKSDYYLSQNKNVENLELANSDYYTSHLLRLPLFYGLTEKEQEKIIQSIKSFFE